MWPARSSTNPDPWLVPLPRPNGDVDCVCASTVTTDRDARASTSAIGVVDRATGCAEVTVT
jgi:hypothetical protein